MKGRTRHSLCCKWMTLSRNIHHWLSCKEFIWKNHGTGNLDGEASLPYTEVLFLSRRQGKRKASPFRYISAAEYLEKHRKLAETNKTLHRKLGNNDRGRRSTQRRMKKLTNQPIFKYLRRRTEYGRLICKRGCDSKNQNGDEPQ